MSKSNFNSKRAFAVVLTMVLARSVGAQPVQNIDTGSYFATIQAAINDAGTLNGHTIVVDPGTYVENVVLNKSLTLSGAQAGVDARGRVSGAPDDSVETVVAPASGTAMELKAGSAGSVIDGFALVGGASGITSSSGPINDVEILNNHISGTSSSAVFLNDSGTDITVHQNSLDGSSMTGGGGLIHLDTDAFHGLYVTSNWLLNQANGFGLFVDGNRNVKPSVARSPLLNGNLFQGNQQSLNIGSRALEGAEISENSFRSNSYDGLLGGPKDTLITENVFWNNGRYGIALTSFGNTSSDRGAQGCTITCNLIIDNGYLHAGAGILFSSGQAAGTISTNILEDNDIVGNSAGAIYSGGETIDAEDNWWGDASGPGGAGPGSGDTISSANIDADPWLAAHSPCAPITPSLVLTFDEVCYQTGGTVTATLSMAGLGSPAAGFQAFLAYDQAVLSFTGWTYTPTPFGLAVLNTLATVNPNPGELNLASGIDQLGGQTPSSADADLVTLTFTIIGSDDCSASDLLTFRTHAPPTRLTNLQGQELLPLTLTDAPDIEIDGTPPVLTCPADIIVDTDPGECEADVVVTPPTPTDNCGVTSLTYVRSDNGALTLSDPFPLGITTITWTATDCAGNSSQCMQTVTVEDNEDPIVTAGSIATCYPDVPSAEAAAIAATTYSDNCTTLANLVVSASTSGTCSAVVTVTVTDESSNSSSVMYNTRIDNTPPVITCPPNVAVQCLAEADPGLFLGTTNGGVAIYYNNNGGGENPANQAYLRAQFSETSTAGAPFLFDNSPLTGNGVLNWHGIYSGLTYPDSQFGLDLVLEVPSTDGSVPTPVLNAYDNGNNDVSGRILVGPVTWAINDYKPHTPDITAGDVLNSIIRSQSPGVAATDVIVLRNDVSVSGTVYTAHIAGKLVSDGINHWYGLATPDSPMANLNLNGDFYFEGVLTYDTATDTNPLMDFYAGAITLTANFPSSAVGFATATDNCTPFPVIAYSDTDNGGSGCNGDPLVITRTWTATDECGNQSSCVQTITVEDDTAPTFLSVPADITADADVGGCDLSLSTAEIGAPTAADNCDLSVDITWVRSDGAANLDDPFDASNSPITITWTATDDCDNATNHVQTVTVNAFNDMAVTLTLASVTQSPLQRCITFELWDCNAAVPTATIVKQIMTFTTGVGGITANTVVPIPCGAYTCITARDQLHTLRRTLNTPDFGIVGTQYVADFDAAGKPLIGGNLNDDIYIDILDFGLFAGHFSTNYGFTDTTCTTSAPHADISGNGTVFTEDFTFIQTNFLDQSEANCCSPGPAPILLAQAGPREDANGDGAVNVVDLSYVKSRLGQPATGENASADVNGDGGINIADLSAVKSAMISQTPATQDGPVERISTAELAARGMNDLISADLNGDGWLDQQDVAAFMNGQRP